MVEYPQIAQIGLIGIRLAGLDWNMVCFMDIRHSKSFFGWNPIRKMRFASSWGQVDALFRLGAEHRS
jgi:hypothetical protein